MKLRFLGVVLVLGGCGAAAPPSTTPPPATRAALAPVVDPCAAIAAPSVDLGMGCIAAGADAWIVELGDLVVPPTPADDAADYDDRTTGNYRIVYVRRDGARALWEPQPFAIGTNARFALRVLGVYDWDGDGAADLALAAERGEYDDGSGYRYVLSAPIGSDEVVTLPVAADFAEDVDEVRDVDGDGRPDFITMTPWREGGWGYSEGGGGWWGGPRTLRRALPDGTFAIGDAAGRAFWAEACPAVEALVPSMTDPDDQGTYERLGDAVGNVTCAALTSSSIEDVRERLAREWTAEPCTFDAQRCAALYDELSRRIDEVERSR